MLKNSSKDVIKRLEEWQQDQAVSSNLLESYKNLLSIQVWAEERVQIETPVMSKKTAQSRITNGKPVLTFEDLKIDWQLADETFKKVIDLFANSPEIAGEVPAFFSDPDFKLRKEMAKAWFTWFNGADLGPGITDDDNIVLKAMIHAAIKPFITAYARALADVVETDNWRKGICPICGGIPDISYIEKENSERWLMCSRCDTQWRFQRLECPHCGNKEQETLSYFSDDTETYRLYVCDKCHTYIKTVDLKKAGKNVCLPIERLLTFDMDVQAQKKGYNPPG